MRTAAGTGGVCNPLTARNPEPFGCMGYLLQARSLHTMACSQRYRLAKGGATTGMCASRHYCMGIVDP